MTGIVAPLLAAVELVCVPFVAGTVRLLDSVPLIAFGMTVVDSVPLLTPVGTGEVESLPLFAIDVAAEPVLATGTTKMGSVPLGANVTVEGASVLETGTTKSLKVALGTVASVAFEISGATAGVMVAI